MLQCPYSSQCNYFLWQLTKLKDISRPSWEQELIDQEEVTIITIHEICIIFFILIAIVNCQVPSDKTKKHQHEVRARVDWPGGSDDETRPSRLWLRPHTTLHTAHCTLQSAHFQALTAPTLLHHTAPCMHGPCCAMLSPLKEWGYRIVFQTSTSAKKNVPHCPMLCHAIFITCQLKALCVAWRSVQCCVFNV